MNPLSQQALVDIVKSAGETPQYDCKAPMKWDGDKQSAGLAKDILACSNSRNGGILVIGKREQQPGEFEFTGVRVCPKSISFIYRDLRVLSIGLASEATLQLRIFESDQPSLT